MNTCAILLLITQSLCLCRGVPVFEVDLDKPPRQRFGHIAKYWGHIGQAMSVALLPRLKEILGDSFDEWKGILNASITGEREEELKGYIEAQTDPHFTAQESLEIMKLTQALYELGSPTACSGVLWAMANGTVIHGRNMDYSFHFNVTDKVTGQNRTLNWPDVTHEIIFKKGGKPFYRSTAWPGSIGLSTAMRYDGWTFEQNTRSLLNNAKDNLEAARQGGKLFGIVARDAMEAIPDFETAVQHMYSQKYMAPQYFIMAGAGSYEGAVLTIDRLGRHEANTTPIMRINKTARAWHLVQTNDDEDKKALDPRRPIANMELQAMQQTKTTVENMFQFMTSPPLFNPGTVYTDVMVPATGFYHTVLPNETAVGKAIMLSTARASPNLLQKSRHVQRHSPTTRINRQRLRGAQSEPEEDNAAFMQVSIQPIEL